MKLGTARTLTAVYLVAALFAVTWPGLVPFARIEPLVFGLPLSMAWIAAWVAGTVITLALVDRVERRHRTPDEEAPGGGRD